MDVYILTSGEYSDYTIRGIYATLQDAMAIIPRASWPPAQNGRWSAEDPDRPGREWVSEHWEYPQIEQWPITGDVGIYDEECTPPSPPRCPHRIVIGPALLKACTLLAGHEGDHSMTTMYSTAPDSFIVMSKPLDDT